MGRAVTHAVLLATVGVPITQGVHNRQPPNATRSSFALEARSRGVQSMCFRMQGICTIYPLRSTQELIGITDALPGEYF
jgi:hypothetical protein